MKKLYPILTLHNLLRTYPRQRYCTYAKILKGHYFPNNSNTARFPSRPFSTLLPLENSGENGVKKLLEEYPDPKKLLWKIINEAYIIQQNSAVKPTVTVKQISQGVNNQMMWQIKLAMTWPERFETEGLSSKKSEAETIAYLNACQKLKEYGIIDQNNQLLLPKNIMTFGDTDIRYSKGELGNIFQRIWTRYGKQEFIPKYKTVKIKGIFGKEDYWKSELQLTYPEAKTFEGCAARLRDAESIAATKALHWLHEKGVINKKKQLVVYSKSDVSKLEKVQSAPCSVYVPETLQDKMSSVLCDIEKEKTNFPFENNEIIKELMVEEKQDEVYDIITENIYMAPSETEIILRSREMFEKRVWFGESSEPELLEIKRVRSSLPISGKREEILKTLEENQVVVLSGDTGCGKTTQVPQFILDDYISHMKGALCNIVVTQPRRISAICVAERVAAERGEKIGESIGYHVRLNKNLPKNRGAILFCSTGMLLRKLSSNLNLEGISHVIVDEVHERNIQIDFLLILLRKLIENNKHIKIILMSATFNTCTFSQYFNNCPTVRVPGNVFPVKDYFLEDLENFIPGISNLNRNDSVLDSDLVVKVINHINATQEPGAILCFLPGWNDIRTVHGKLLESNPNSSKLMICPAHSRLPHSEQRIIFEKPPEGVRKVILSTNIAETSITVDDVVYVVDSGLHKSTSFDGEKGIASLATEWVTKANVRQRRGRAGRVKSGICYHLYKLGEFHNMAEYPIPELLRVPLENVILKCKLYCSNEKAEDVLSCALQPPTTSAIQNGVNELQELGILNEEENLTDLGKIVVNFGTHPRLSVALIYAAFLGCLNPVLNISAALTFGREPFINTLKDPGVIKEMKQAHDNLLYSDHLALSKIIDTWIELKEKSDASDYAANNLLDENNLTFIRDLKGLFSEDLYSAGILDKQEAYSDPLHKCNANSSHIRSILAALSAAFFPNVMKVSQGEVTHGKLKKDALTYSLLKGQRGYIQKESVVSNEYEFPSPWLIYFSALKSDARRLMMTSTVSSVPGLCLLLFNRQKLIYSMVTPEEALDSNNVIISVENYNKLNFLCSEKEAELLMSWRKVLDEMFNAYIQNLKNASPGEYNKMLTVFNSSFLPVTKELLDTPQIPFTKGKIYKFVNGNLVSETW